ncbi:MAG: DEAD/DEAH box helicase [Alphaproteobacteria bacterium]|nr:DEAD/DEAH box helicase [Alphaproteobacteria bacterium SS10]
MGFDQLGLNDKIMQAVTESGYNEPTPIQAKAIPPILMGQDVVGCAQTGTGKTASFTLPMIEILSTGRARARMPRSLILAPTRELAAQVAENFDKYGKYIPLTKALLVGGVSMNEQIDKLDRGVDVLIATPGRLLDLFERGRILLSDIKLLVIDECDRMMDMGFIPDIERIVGLLPKRRQTLMFSATLAPEIRRLVNSFMMTPKEISVAPPASPAKTVTQSLVKVAPRQKNKTLIALLDQEEVKNAFIFCNRKRDIDGVKRALDKAGYKAGQLHGDMVQTARTETLQRFKDNEINLLVCSDVAARGLDIKGLSHVFNVDVPFNAEDYVHRIGRTGRAGMKGRAFTLAGSEDDKFVDAIEKLVGGAIPVMEIGGKASGKPAKQATDEEANDKPAPKQKSKGRKTTDDMLDEKQGASSDDGDQENDGRDNRRRRSRSRDDNRSRDDRSRDDRSRDDRPKRRRNNDRGDDDGRDEVGFGDHMPAFMR